ncbi:hypothetical protein, partial [Acidisoma sp. S159]
MIGHLRPKSFSAIGQNLQFSGNFASRRSPTIDRAHCGC